MRGQLLFFTIICGLQIAIAQNCEPESTHHGEGTYYDVDKNTIVNCSYDMNVLAGIDPFYIGAMNKTDYDASNACGACALVTGPYGDQITVKIVDQCPECLPGDIDFSPTAFEQLAPKIEGRIDISWEYIPCPFTTEKINLRYKENSSQYWMGINAFDTRNRIVSIEGKSASKPNYLVMTRQSYNFFELENGLGPAPHTFRITDIYGNQAIVESQNIESDQTVVVPTDQQFDDCVATDLGDDLNLADSYIFNNTLFLSSIMNTKVLVYDLLGRKLYYIDATKNSYDLQNANTPKIIVIRNTLSGEQHTIRSF